MSLTPEQWRELDNGLSAYEKAAAAGNWSDAADMGPMLRLRLFGHARFLIDAARPKCEGCKGRATVGFDACPDCNGTGWAT